MDVVEVFLLCVVACSVLVFLIIDIFDSFEKRRKGNRVGDGVLSAHDAQNIVGDEIAVDSGESAAEEQNIVGGEIAENFGESTTGEQNTVGVEIAENIVESTTEEQSIVGKEIPENFREETVKAEEERGRIGCTELGFCSGEGEGGFGDDDWEGIERTGLEKIFGSAMIFCNNNADRIADVKMELYGLQQVALEGPCHGSQPMALNVPARSKWNAWQKVGDMSREAAMEKYVEVLSKAVPRWKGEDNVVI